MDGGIEIVFGLSIDDLLFGLDRDEMAIIFGGYGWDIFLLWVDVDFEDWLGWFYIHVHIPQKIKLNYNNNTDYIL